jgi:hypothetical protein
VPAFQEGDLIAFEQVEKLRPYLPPEFWANRDFFFYEGMSLEIGPSHRDYAAPEVYREATRSFQGQAKLGPENSLVDYRAGQPFPMEEIDCAGDPQAGAKIAWNFVRRWEGSGGTARFYYSYWDRGEELPLYYEGRAQGVSLAFRPEPQYAEHDGDVFRREKRYVASGPQVDAPFEARRTTTPGSTSRRCAGSGASRPLSARMPSRARTSRSMTSSASTGSSLSTTGSVWAGWRSSPP